MTDLRRKHLRLLNAAHDIAAQPLPKNDDLVFAAREFVQATLPHRQPRYNPPEWHRTNGNYTLSIQPGYATDPGTSKRSCLGYPFGSIPRLVLFWITTEALRTRSPQLWLGPSLSAFMREIGLNPDNGGTGAKRSDARRLRDQLERLFRARISFEFNGIDDERRSRRFMNMDIAEGGELWWDPKRPDQVNLFESWITLGRTFYEALIANPVPADLRALRALKSSPLALDLYTWLAYRAHRVTEADKPVRVTWKQLADQLGGDYADPKDFKRFFRPALAKVLALYPKLHVELVYGGIMISPCGRLKPARQ
jgi:hypothetical protein